MSMDTSIQMFLSIVPSFCIGWLIELGFLNVDNAPTADASDALPTDLEVPSTDQVTKMVILYHDETAFQSNDHEHAHWGTKDDHVLLPKTKGAGIMISDFICGQDGYLKLLHEEFTAGCVKVTGLKQGNSLNMEKKRWLLDFRQVYGSTL